MGRSRSWIVLGAVSLLALGASRGAAQLPPGREEPRETTPARPTLPTTTVAPQPSRYFSVEAHEIAVDPATYILGPQDVLAFMLLLGEVKLERLPVLPEGVVLVPGVGAVPAAGRTLKEFREALRQALSKRYRDFEVYCYLAEARQFRVNVTGEVREPGTLVARAYERISELIERAGGFTDAASRRRIEIRDPSGGVRTLVDLDAYYRRGEGAANPHLAPGEAVFVPVRQRRVDIVGAVARPGAYESLPGESLRALLEVAGGPMPQADLAEVSVDRMDAQGVVRVELMDLTGNSPTADDVVRLSVRSSLLGKARVFVTLPDGRRETLYLSDRETLRTLVPRVVQIDPNTALHDATLASRDSTGKQEEVHVDLAQVLSGAQDHLVRDGDVFSVSGVRDYVYVSGMVAQPGRFPYRADWEVNDYIGQAGGTAPGGNRDHVTLLSADGTARSGKRGSDVGRGETIHVNRSTGSKMVAALGVLTSVSALVISVVALTTQ